MIAALLDGGADPNARIRGRLGTPALRGTATPINPAVIAALLDGGADPNARIGPGLAPLHFAVSSVIDNPAVIAALLDRRSRPEAHGTGINDASLMDGK